MAGLDRVPVIVHEIDDAAAANLAVLDNLHRDDLNPIEETEAILVLVQSALSVDREGAVAKVRAAGNVAKGRPQDGLTEEELTTTVATPLKAVKDEGRLQHHHRLYHHCRQLSRVTPDAH